MRSCFLVLFLFFMTSSMAQTTIAQVQESAYADKIEQYISRSVPLIDVDELYNRYSDFTILDNRTEEEFKISHLKNAVWVKPETIDEKLLKLPQHKPIAVYCTVGARSEDLGERLADMGFTVYNVYGGIIEWVNREYPVYNENEGEIKTIHTYNVFFRKYVTNSSYKKVGLLKW